MGMNTVRIVGVQKSRGGQSDELRATGVSCCGRFVRIATSKTPRVIKKNLKGGVKERDAEGGAIDRQPVKPYK